MTQHFTHVGFLIPGNFAEDDPLTGIEATLDLIARGEALGYHSAWVRQRHLERGVSSAAVFLAAASQRTHRIGLGTAVIPLGYENPFRLAEDLATVDVLSRGRLNIGVSANPPQFARFSATFCTTAIQRRSITDMSGRSGWRAPCGPSRCLTPPSPAMPRAPRSRACNPSPRG